MPRPNRPRAVFAEQHLARRIATERAKKGWSLEGLAKRVSDTGCAINASAIYKIERADPPRRITVDELVGFSQAFGIGIDELLLPPEIAMRKEVGDLVIAWDAARLGVFRAQDLLDEAWKGLLSYAAEVPEAHESLQWVFEQWGDFYVPDDQLMRDVRVTEMIWKSTGAANWEQRFREAMQRVVADVEQQHASEGGS